MLTGFRHQVKVAVLGAAGGIGQPLSLLLKGNTTITELALYDVANTAGVAADLSHINTPAKVAMRTKIYRFPEGKEPTNTTVVIGYRLPR